MNSFSQLMNENIDGINMTSNDARRFGEMRQNMKQAIGVPTTMEDPETGEIFDIDPNQRNPMGKLKLPKTIGGDIRNILAGLSSEKD